jgi:hypothetical protein
MTRVAKHQDLAQAEPLPGDAPDEPVNRTGEKLKITVESETYIFRLVTRVLLVAALSAFAHSILALNSILSLVAASIIVFVFSHPGYEAKIFQHINDLARKFKKK